MLSLMAILLLGSILLGLAWVAVFWVASFLIFLVAWFLSLFGVYCDIASEKNLWFLFLVVIGISTWIYGIDGSNIGYAVFVFLTGSFMLFRSASVWKIATC